MLDQPARDIATRILHGAIVAATLSASPGCALARLAKAGPAEPAGYIEQPERMAAWPERTPWLHSIWFEDREAFYASRGAYKKIVFRPVRTDFLLARGWWDELNSFDEEGYRRDVEDLARYLHSALRTAFVEDPSKRLAVADEPDAETIVYEFALVEVVPTKVHLNAAGTIASAFVPGGGAVKMVAKGSIAVEVKLSDGGTGKLIGTWTDREQDQASLFTARDFSSYAHARSAIDEWAAELVESWNTPIDHTVDDRLPFTIMPY